MIVRALCRSLYVCLALARSALCYLFLRFRGQPDLLQRADWLHRSCKSVLDAMDIRCRVEGTAPSSGLLVANHLSYLDILVLGATTPCCFVSKREVRKWPIFGLFGALGGTLFLDRASRVSAARTATAIEQRLTLSLPIVLFPEGTSTDGSTVLPFHSWLFEPLVECGAYITVASLRYQTDGNKSERDLCWFGDASFLPHLFSVLTGETITVQICYGGQLIYEDRRKAARATREAILALRETVSLRQSIRLFAETEQEHPA